MTPLDVFPNACGVTTPDKPVFTSATTPQTVVIPGYTEAVMWGYCTPDKKPCSLDGRHCAPAEGLMAIQNIDWEKMTISTMQIPVISSKQLTRAFRTR